MSTTFSSNLNEDAVQQNIYKIAETHAALCELEDYSFASLIRIKSNFRNYDNNLAHQLLKKLMTADIEMVDSIHVYFDKVKFHVLPDMEKGNVFYSRVEKNCDNVERMISFSKTESKCKFCDCVYQVTCKMKICNNCKKIKNIISSEGIVEQEEITNDKKNIDKHYYETLKKIYGVVPKDKAIPREVIAIIRDRLKKQKIDIRESVHYTYTLLCHMKVIGKIKYKNKIYDVGKYKNQSNYILANLYPDLKIPQLNIDKFNIIKSIFMNISAEFQQQFPNSYSNNYMYTIFKIIYHVFPYDHNARELLKFIYIQKPDSLRSKDEKLKNVNLKIKEFESFQYTPEDVYNLESMYCPELN
ncbi:MAG: hypothetical protein CMM93_07040 [Rickettsiales bacterium]|nr:hypothetical protein [Rickettsiales bacterium]